MKIIKILTVIMIAVILLPSMISCSRLSFLQREKPKTTKYVNSDYHFSLVYPTAFEEIKEIPSEENGDEYRIELKKSDTEVIYIDITYKKAANLYEYAELYGYDKTKIKPLSMTEFDRSVNSFVYDNRNSPSYVRPAYYIFASTKRMLYTVCYEFDRGDTYADEVCDSLEFEFDIYANVPKDNQFLSPPCEINSKTASICIPADYSTVFYPFSDTLPKLRTDEETGEVIYPDYSGYRTVEAFSDAGYLYLTMPEEIDCSIPQLAEDTVDELIRPSVIQLCGDKVSSVAFGETGVYKVENGVTYRNLYFTCNYKGRTCSGTLTVGFSRSFKFFKFIYLLADGASAAERQCYEDALHSLKLN